MKEPKQNIEWSYVSELGGDIAFNMRGTAVAVRNKENNSEIRLLDIGIYTGLDCHLAEL